MLSASQNFNKCTTGLLIIVFFTASISGFLVLLEPKPVQALFLPGSAEGDNLELNCGGTVGPLLVGTCVPIQVQADINRGKRNTLKNIFSIFLYGLSTALGQWLAQTINNKLKIRDYYGYNRSLKDTVYRYRILFDEFKDPTTRMLVDLAYDAVLNQGGLDYSRVARTVETIARDNLPFQLPQPTPRSAPPGAFFESPDFFAKAALTGQENMQPTDWYFNFIEQGLALQSKAGSAANQEVAQSEGYKSTRLLDDINKLGVAVGTPPYIGRNTPGPFYTNTVNPISPLTGLIQAPGPYAAKVVQSAIEKLISKDYLPTGIIPAMAAEGIQMAFLRLFSGGLFGNSTAAVGGRNTGNPTNPTTSGGGEVFYQDPNSITPTGDLDCTGDTRLVRNPVTGVDECVPNTRPLCDSVEVGGFYTVFSPNPTLSCEPVAVPPLCTIESNPGSGIFDEPQPCTVVVT